MNGSPDFLDLRTRAEFLELCGDKDAARRLQEQSLEIAREVDLVCYAYQLMWRDRVADAIDLLTCAAERYPSSWNVFHSLAEAYEQNGEPEKAIDCYRKAGARVETREETARIARRLTGLSDLATAC